MASNRGNQGSGNQAGNQSRGSSGNQAGNQGGGSSGSSSDRGFAGMSDEEQREIARKGDESSSRSQPRDEQGQFDSNRHSGGSKN